MMKAPSRLAERLLCLGVAATCLGATCVPNPNEHPQGDLAMAPVGVGFAQIEADIKMSCGAALMPCHSPQTTNMFKVAADPMANYQTVKTFVNEASPADSVLLQKALGMGTPVHGGGAVFASTTDATYQKWLKWIQDGLIFDPTVKRVTYADIETDMRDAGAMGCGAALSPCHGAMATTNRLKLGADRAANYQLVKTMFLDLMTPANSLLLVKATGGLTHTGGSPLKTSDAVYVKWLAWITDGAKEK